MKRDLTAIETQSDDWELAVRYKEAVRSGDLPSGGERFLDYVAPSNDEAEAFDGWFYSAETKAGSIQYVHAFILRSRHQLFRTP